MKFAAAVLVNLIIALVLVWGILQAVHGHYGLLIGGALAYIVALGKIGCLPSSDSH